MGKRFIVWFLVILKKVCTLTSLRLQFIFSDCISQDYQVLLLRQHSTSPLCFLKFRIGKCNDLASDLNFTCQFTYACRNITNVKCPDGASERKKNLFYINNASLLLHSSSLHYFQALKNVMPLGSWNHFHDLKSCFAYKLLKMNANCRAVCCVYCSTMQQEARTQMYLPMPSF